MADSPSSVLDATGKRAGEYVLGRKLGEGGCGSVYEAEHPLLGRRAAVKVLHRTPSAGSASLQRFVAEAKSVNQIRSRHIVDVFSFGELDDGRPFYVMDLLEGEPLDVYLARLGQLGVPAMLAIVRPIVAALDIAHAAGIVHRDLKPKNIFVAVDASGEIVPKLLDFGVAKLLHDAGELTVSGAVLGTPLYMSPEQARGERVDARSDVYALGVLCYELATGTLPFNGDTVLAIAMAHITQVPEPPSKRADVPAELDPPILDMLAKSACDRPPTAGAAFAALCAAAERARIAVPADTSRLPPPRASQTRTPQLATTVEDPSAGSAERPVAQPLESRPERRLDPTVRRTWLVALVLLIALGITALLVRGRASPTTRDAGVSTPSVAPASPATPFGVGSGAPATSPDAARLSAPHSNASHAPPAADPPSAAPADSENAAKPPPAKRRRRAPAKAGEAIPSDLENPF